MRFALGAGAVAAVSVLTVGLVKPDFGGSIEQPVVATNDPGLAVGSVEGTSGQTTRVRHVTEYVFLKPGEKAPPGATVISNERLYGARNPAAQPPAAGADPTRRPAVAVQPSRQPTTQTNRPPTTQQKPKPPAQAATPTPRPRPTTRQSGRR